MAGPKLFRLIVHVSGIDRATEFYSQLFLETGRRIHGSRHYFDCGDVIFALLDPGGSSEQKPLPDYVYFAVDDLEGFHARARQLNCLSTEDVHGASAGEITKRPWGERSFYAQDPFGNGLCFVDSKTIFTGR
jgi:hypothetical protein